MKGFRASASAGVALSSMAGMRQAYLRMGRSDVDDRTAPWWCCRARSRSAVISSVQSNSWRPCRISQSAGRGDNGPPGRPMRSTPSLPTRSRKMMAPSRGMSNVSQPRFPCSIARWAGSRLGQVSASAAWRTVGGKGHASVAEREP
jgi:hypothetical protein